EVLLRHVQIAAATGEDRRLVADVRKLGAGEAARLTRDLVEVDIGSERLAARMHSEDRLAAGEIRRRDEHLAIEAAGTEECGVEILDAVGGAHDDHLLSTFEPVQLHEQLVERLVLLTVEAVAGALRTDGVELVDEHDRGRVLARLEEELANTRRTEPGEHLDERRRARRVEMRTRLVRNRLREERLARAGRPVQEQALRHLRAQSLEALRVAQEVDDLHQLRADLLDACDVVPGDLRLPAALDMRRADARHHPHGPPQQPRRDDEDPEEREREPRRGEISSLMEPVPHHPADTSSAGRHEPLNATYCARECKPSPTSQ